MPSTGQTPDRTTTAQQFGGFVLEISPLALPAGVNAMQVNIGNENRGLLETRRGLKEVTFNE